MKALAPELHFDPNKPFYSLVLGYLAQVHGFIEICSRGMHARLRTVSKEALEAWLQQEERELTKAAILSAIRGEETTLLLGKQELSSRTAAGIRVDIAELARETVDNHDAGIRYFNRISAGGLLILAWELTTNYHSHDDLWEFLRHCRNAAAHQGHLHFLHGEPRRSARWRSLEITPSLQGKALFPNPPAEGFIGIGDVMYLLADIEATFPEIE